MVDLVIPCARGTERSVVFELKDLGYKGTGSDRGIVTLEAPLEAIPRLNIHLRSASRVLWVLERFQAKTEKELVAHLSEFPFEKHLMPETTFAVDAHLRDADWDHTHYASQRIKDIIVDRLRDQGKARPNVDIKDPFLRFVLHWEKNQVSFGVDTSGKPLFKRRYRIETGEAPMKETLAAAILATGHADVSRPYWDICCGSGTLAIEQALRSMKRGPGMSRKFGFERWAFARELSTALKEARVEAKDTALKEPQAIIRLSDRDPKAIQIAQANIDRARLADFLKPELLDAKDIDLQGLDAPVVMANLPYGERISKGEEKQLQELYRAIDIQAHKQPGTRLLLFTGAQGAQDWFKNRPQHSWDFRNGPIKTKLFRWDI